MSSVIAIKKVEQMNSIIELFLASVAQYPQHQALWVNNRYYSYEQLLTFAVPLRNWLDIQTDSRCLIFAPRTFTSYIGIIATLLAEKAYVSINPLIPPVRNSKMIHMAKSNTVIADSRYENEIIAMLDTAKDCQFSILLYGSEVMPPWTKDFSQHSFVLMSDLSSNSDDNEMLFSNQLHPDACLLFTSGSTGDPKAVMLSHRNILSYLSHTVIRYRLTPYDRISQMTELTFDFSVQDIFMGWGVGACVYAFPEKYFLCLPKYLQENEISIMVTVPSTARLLQQLGKLTPNAFPALRLNIFGGEPLSDNIAELWQQAAPNTEILNVCGPTEATVSFLTYPWQRSPELSRDCIPLGKPLPGQKINILNEKFQHVSTGEIGELCLAGSQVIAEYWDNPALTEQKFFDAMDQKGELIRWYRTGDMVLLDDNNEVIFKGRKDDQLQIRGCRVEKLEIESVIRTLANTEDVAVIPWPIAEDGTVQGVIVFLSHTLITARELHTQCQLYFPDYMIPKEIHFIEQLPLNINGKIDYIELKKLRQTTDQHRKLFHAVQGKLV